MVSAYSTLAAGGQYRAADFYYPHHRQEGQRAGQFVSENQRVLSDKTAGDLINMLRDAVDLGTGQAVRARFGVRADVAGKTGTTQKNTDGWFILMHPRLVAGSWVGFNDSRITMRSDYWGEGGHNALLLVGDFFQQALTLDLSTAAPGFPMNDRTTPSGIRISTQPKNGSARLWIGCLEAETNRPCLRGAANSSAKRREIDSKIRKNNGNWKGRLRRSA